MAKLKSKSIKDHQAIELANTINNAGIDTLVGAFGLLGFRLSISLVPVFGMPENP